MQSMCLKRAFVTGMQHSVPGRCGADAEIETAPGGQIAIETAHRQRRGGCRSSRSYAFLF